MGTTTTANTQSAESPPFEVDRKSLFGDINGNPLTIPIIGVTGKKGSGKTMLGLTLDPENTIVIDVEDSSVTYSLPLKRRISLYDEVETSNADGIPSPKDCWEWFLQQIETLDCRVLFVDPITDLQQGLMDWVRDNPEKFGRTANQYEKATGLLWADVKAHLKMVLGRLSRRVECFIFTAHMGSVWAGGKPVPGKAKAKGVDTFYELASLYLHLNRDVDPKTLKQPGPPTASITPPIGKSRLARTDIAADGEVAVSPILPPTVKAFTWVKLRAYVAKPPNYAKLKKDELALDDSLTDDEKLLLQAQIAEANRDAEEIKSGRQEAAAQAAKRNAAARAEASSKSAAAKAEAIPAAETADAPEPIELTREQKIELIRQQFSQLNIKAEDAKRAIRKRGGERLADLTDDALENLRKALWTKLTQRELAGKK